MTERPCESTDLPLISDFTLGYVSSYGAFVLETRHPLRGAGCVFCHRPIGTEHAAVFGLAGLGGNSDETGCISGHLYLGHAHCEPATETDLFMALQLALTCPSEHPWD